MKLSKVFYGEHIIAEMKAVRKDEAIRELVGKHFAVGSLPEKMAFEVERAVMRREELGSTGIGKGVGVPHAKCAVVEGVVGAFGRSTAGVAFNDLDGQPVHLIFLLFSSPDAVEPHLEVLRKVTALFRDDNFCMFMRRAKGQAELAELLCEAEERLAV